MISAKTLVLFISFAWFPLCICFRLWEAFSAARKSKTPGWPLLVVFRFGKKQQPIRDRFPRRGSLSCRHFVVSVSLCGARSPREFVARLCHREHSIGGVAVFYCTPQGAQRRAHQLAPHAKLGWVCIGSGSREYVTTSFARLKAYSSACCLVAMLLRWCPFLFVPRLTPSRKAEPSEQDQRYVRFSAIGVCTCTRGNESSAPALHPQPGTRKEPGASIAVTSGKVAETSVIIAPQSVTLPKRQLQVEVHVRTCKPTHQLWQTRAYARR